MGTCKIFMSLAVALVCMFIGTRAQAQQVLMLDACGNVVAVQPQFDFDDINFGCVSKSITAFRSCRQEGNGVFSCGLLAFGSYLDCNGGLAARRRAKRRARRSSMMTSCY